MPVGRAMETLDERTVRAPVATMFDIARDVEHWPAHLSHYRYVRFRERTGDGGGIVEMSANRPFPRRLHELDPPVQSENDELDTSSLRVLSQALRNVARTSADIEQGDPAA